MKRFDRYALRLLATASIVGALTCACITTASASQRPSAKSTATVTLNALFPEAAGPTSPYTPLITDFEKAYPHIKINYTFAPVADYWTLLETQLKSGSGPDLFETRPGIGQLGSVQLFAKAGYVANLTNGGWVDKILPALIPGVTYKKKIEALPLGLQIQGLAYSKAIFDKLKLKVPTDFSQMLDVCRKIAATGRIPIAFPAGSVTYDQVMGIARAVSVVYATDPTWNTLRARKKTTFAKSAAWASAMQSIVNMNKSGCFGQGAAALQPANALSDVVDGSAAMIFGPSVLAGDIVAEKPSLKMGVFTIPPPLAKNTVIPVSANEQISANAHSKKLAAAETFIDYLAGTKEMALWIKVSGTISPETSSAKRVPSLLTAVGSELQAGKIISGPEENWPNPNVYSVAMADGVQGLLTGQYTVKQVLQSMDAAW